MGIFGVHTAFCGLGKPTIKLEFEDNASLLDFRQKMQEAEEGAPQNADFVDTEAEDVTGRKELKGVEENEDDFYNEIINNAIKKNPQKFSYKLLNEDFGEEKNGIFKISTPWGIVNFRRSSLFYDNKHIIKHLENNFNFLKPTLTNPYIIFESYDKDGYKCIDFVRAFEYNKGKYKIVVFSAVNPETRDLKTIYQPDNEKKYLWKKYKIGGFNRLYTDQKGSVSDNASNVNGLETNELNFEVVNILLPCKIDKKITDNQNFNKILEGFGKTANPLLYNNLDILESRDMKPTYKILDSYEEFFDTAKNLDSFSGFGLSDTKKLIKETCLKHYPECYRIAQHLKADSMLQSAYNLWHWMHHNIRYEYDREGREEIRTPLRTWADRKRGVDCDCLSVFAWCVLKCMGYEPAFELAAFRNKDQFSHIYINLDGILIDRVWFIFNCLPPHVTKRELFFINKKQNLGSLF